MQDKIILGFLMIRRMTAYELKKAMEKSTSFFYNTSMGSIHPALKKLEKNGFVISEVTLEKGRGKKIYEATDAGRASFVSWIGEDIEPSKLKNESVLRMFFFHHLPDEVQKGILERYLEKVHAQEQALQVILDGYDESAHEGDVKRIAEQQLWTVRYGIAHHQFLQNWFSDYLRQLGTDGPEEEQ